ncbi:MAG: hypothetical protein AB1352_05035 [Patescibacteria group bacterium]
MSKFLSRRAVTIGASLIGALVVIFITPIILLQAQSTSSTSLVEEDVIIQDGDQPLERQAKLRRTWVVYREVDSPSIYAITRKQSDGKHHKREIQTLAFFTKFHANYLIKLVAKGRLDAFPTDGPITSVDNLNPADFVKAPWRYRLVKAAHSTAVYLVTPDGRRRVIIAEGVFHRFGWEFRDVETISETELMSIPEDTAVTDATVFSEDVNIDTTQKRLTTEQIIKRLNLQRKLTVRQRLIKAIGSPDIYIIDAKGVKHRIVSEVAALKNRLNLKATTEVTQEELAAIPLGHEITESAASINLNATVSQ